MYPFYNNPTLGFPPFPVIPFNRRNRVRTIDEKGIYEVYTTGINEDTQSEEEGVTYGINPCVWKALPNECIILWKVRHPVSQSGASMPVALAVPISNSSTTVSSSTSTGATKKVAVVDNKGTQTEGRDVTVPTGSGSDEQQSYTTEHMVYVNKCNDTFRLLGVTAQNSPARVTTPTGGDTPAS